MRLGELLQMPRQNVSNWFHGSSLPQLPVTILIAEHLRTSVSYLVGETDDPRPAREWHTSPSSAQQHALSLVRDQLAQLLGQVERLMEADLVDVEMAEQIKIDNRSQAAEILQPEKSTTREAK